MTPALPTDQREGERLELKSLAALAEPDKIAREAVAMLNSKGGEVWIGIKEGQGRNEVEAMPHAEAARARQRLQDHLLDVIEPMPVAGEVTVTDEPVGTGPAEHGRVLRVALEPRPGRGPYALHRRGGRYFLRRFGDRIVPMSRDDIGKAFNPARPTEATGAARAMLQAEVQALLELPTDRFWLGIEPEQAGDLNLRKLRETEMLTEPTLSGTPRGSFNFTTATYRGAARLRKSGAGTPVMIGDDVISLRVLASGGVRFEAALEEIFWVGRVPFVDAERLLSPEALLGYVISVTRLIAALLDEARLWHRPPQEDFWAALGITGLQGWGLLPGDLAGWPSFRYQVSRFQDKDLLLEEPLRFSQEDLRERPDECGMRLVEKIYDGFEIDLLPSIDAAALGHAGLPVVGGDGYSRWVSLDLGGGVRKVARLRRDNVRPSRFEWVTRDGDLVPASGRWVHGWSYVG
jgi:Putative DNA-binding domain